ncbi:3',5'-cyclic-nucleotide phosphodiesterase [Chryseobacterium sp.]|uniref:3',5'-cyclic-nucleotide phosphodiesterase n=1 Tax=Chryseobacterium sp. TaxID=1871047 RepID=UPI002896C2E1|nr:3',5'-cyclic-nucleotide phosphodiesterase [Chryseobacterium sp.]
MIKKVFGLAMLMSVTLYSAQNSFKIIPLGTYGGGDESNLSSYMAAPLNSENYVALDAGTLRAGIQKAIEKGSFSEKSAAEILQKNIKGYMISHGHLDHVSGMVINSPDDSKKYIYALPSVAKILADDHFSWRTWANFTNAGEAPKLGKYNLITLTSGTEIPVTDTEMEVTAFPLSHVKPYESTAFLLRHGKDYVLYLGDTGSDRVEQSDRLQNLWKQVAPLINGNQLKGILIEVSFPNEQPEKSLFGHLTPKLLQEELNTLNSFCKSGKLKQVPVIITHMKPVDDNIEKIKQQLKDQKNSNINYIFPVQGEKIVL